MNLTIIGLYSCLQSDKDAIAVNSWLSILYFWLEVRPPQFFWWVDTLDYANEEPNVSKNIFPKSSCWNECHEIYPSLAKWLNELFDIFNLLPILIYFSLALQSCE